MKFYARESNKLALHAIPGHFATSNSHINFYIDVTGIRSRIGEAEEAAKLLARKLGHLNYVDTVVCMDGTEVIGSYLAEELTRSGIMSMNQHKAMYVVTPEFNSVGQMIFRDNLQPMINGKHILFLLASATTGRTIERSLECVSYYGGIVAGISAIFSANEEIAGQTVHTLFHIGDIPEYKTYPHNTCPFCQSGKRIEAIVNSYGYSKL